MRNSITKRTVGSTLPRQRRKAKQTKRLAKIANSLSTENNSFNTHHSTNSIPQPIARLRQKADEARALTEAQISQNSPNFNIDTQKIIHKSSKKFKCPLTGFDLSNPFYQNPLKRELDMTCVQSAHNFSQYALFPLFADADGAFSRFLTNFISSIKRHFSFPLQRRLPPPQQQQQQQQQPQNNDGEISHQLAFFQQRQNVGQYGVNVIPATTQVKIYNTLMSLTSISNNNMNFRNIYKDLFLQQQLTKMNFLALLQSISPMQYINMNKSIKLPKYIQHNATNKLVSLAAIPFLFKNEGDNFVQNGAKNRNVLGDNLVQSNEEFNTNFVNYALQSNNDLLNFSDHNIKSININNNYKTKLPSTQIQSKKSGLSNAIESIQNMFSIFSTSLNLNSFDQQKQQNQQNQQNAEKRSEIINSFHSTTNNIRSKLKEQLSSDVLNNMTDPLNKVPKMSKKVQQKIQKRARKFFKHTLSSFLKKPQYVSPNTYKLMQKMPLKPPKSLAEYPIIKAVLDSFKKIKKHQKMRLKNQILQKSPLSAQASQFSTQHKSTHRPINLDHLDTFFTIFTPTTSQIGQKKTQKKGKNQQTTNLSSHPTAAPPPDLSLNATYRQPKLSPPTTKPQTKNNINTNNQRGFKFMPQGRTEKLSKMHITQHSETVPFHYHVSDSIRAITKFAFLRLSNPEPLKINRVRAVLMPFWGFQGSLTITHKPSGTTKVVDYNDVERNLDMTMYASLLNVREDAVMFGMSSHHMVNPNCSFGQDFVHKNTDMVSRKAEVYVNQPHSVNTLRMRAQQMFSGSEWAPWQMEGLKVHLHMAQEFKPDFLDFPEHPLFPENFEEISQNLNQKAIELQKKESKDPSFNPTPEQCRAVTEKWIEEANSVRGSINPLSQDYQQTSKLERLFPIVASSSVAITSRQKGTPLETDEHIRSERACLIETLVNIVTLEHNLIQRGVGVTINQEYLSQRKLDELHLQNPTLPDRDPMNENLKDLHDPKSLYDGAFLTMKEQKEMLLELAQQHHTIKGTKMGSNMHTIHQESDPNYVFATKNPLELPGYEVNMSPVFKAHRYFKALVPPQVDKDGRPVKTKPPTNIDPIRFLQERLLSPDLDLKYNEDNNNKQKNKIRLEQKKFRQDLRKKIIDSFLSPKTELSTQNRQISFDIPNSDYSISFSGINSRKIMSPGFVHHYDYFGPNTVVSSAVTGVSTGVPHRHYKSVIKSAITNAIGAGIGAIGLKLLLRRLVLPPIYTAAATALLIVYSLREVLSGHFRYSKDHYEFNKALEKEHEIEQDLYSQPLVSKATATALGQKEHSSETIRDSWEFNPYDGFYTNNNWKAQNIWNAINDKDSYPYRTNAAKAARQKPSHTQSPGGKQNTAHSGPVDEKYEQMKQKTMETEKMKNMRPVYPSDPYLLILGEEYLGIKPNYKKAPIIRLQQVSQIPFDVVKVKYFEQLKYWHPDTHTIYSTEYAEERTRALIEAWGKMNNKLKKDSFDRANYR